MTMGKRARTKKKEGLPPVTCRRAIERGGRVEPLKMHDRELVEENAWLKVQQERFRGRV